ncbi:MAG TPA: hypothetical protein VL403_03585 [Candidatus Kryptonia bacterium]|nr:hypothetical protein [Candidatus Kryptonia bacterium]
MTDVPRLVLALTLGSLLVGCAASRPPAADYESCEQTCVSESTSCRATCLKMTDPSGRIAGSIDSCERTCSTDFALCDLGCVKARDAATR